MSKFSSDLQPMSEVLRAKLDEQSAEGKSQRYDMSNEEVLEAGAFGANATRNLAAQVVALRQKLDDIDALITEGVAMPVALIRKIIGN